jgi:tRNA(Glu) U13 pseudouridine synthase TruD
VQYPSNEIGELYRTFLQQEGVMFVKNRTIESTAKGSYRHLVVDVKDIELHFMVSSVIEDEAFQVTFTLLSGSYATMLLRELIFTTVWRP